MNDSSSFVGAAAVNQVRLFNLHPSGAMNRVERLESVMGEGGVADCGKAQNCVEVCPKEIPLVDSISQVARDTTKHLLFGWLLAGERRFSATGAGLGLLAGGLVGASRFALDTHSVSEVVVAWLAGLVVCSLSLRALDATGQRPWFARLSPLLLLLSFNATASTYLPSHEFEIRIALLLSGRDRHYTRQQSLQPEPGRSQALIGVGHWATLAQ